jgi:fructose-1,6-bisphosphatase II
VNNTKNNEVKKLPSFETFQRVCEFAAIEAARTIGHGAKEASDYAAVRAMQCMFDELETKARIVSTEGSLDNSYRFEYGEAVGMYKDREGEADLDIAIDPLEGTSLCAKGLPGACAVMAVADRGALLNAQEMYMWKMVVGPKARHAIDLRRSYTENILKVAIALEKKPSELTIAVLGRDRHNDLISEIRSTGAMIMQLPAGDLLPGIATCFPDSGIDMLLGAGGGPEGVITAAALKCLGGNMQGRLDVALTEKEMGEKLNFQDVNEDILTIDDLVSGYVHTVIVTAVTNAYWLEGVRYRDQHVHTNTLNIRGTHTYQKDVPSARDLSLHHWAQKQLSDEEISAAIRKYQK